MSVSSLLHRHQSLAQRIIALTGIAAAAVLLATALAPATISAPVQATSSAERRGREAFVTRGCGHCHGDHRQGTDRAPELLTVRKRMKKGTIEKQIRDGGQTMPAFGADLSASELKDLVAYVREKQESSDLNAPASPPANESH